MKRVRKLVFFSIFLIFIFIVIALVQFQSQKNTSLSLKQYGYLHGGADAIVSD